MSAKIFRPVYSWLIKKQFYWLLVLNGITHCLQAQPTINSFNPASGPVGMQVIITGTNFSAAPAGNIVYFGVVKAVVSAASVVSLTVTVPAGVTYSPITVTANNLTGYSSKFFTVTFTGAGNITANSFAAGVDTTTDQHPSGIVMADFDGDGKPDLATANNYLDGGATASVSVLRNTGGGGNISFALVNNIVTGAQTNAIATGDLDGDGKMDLVSVSVADKTISTFRNTSISGSISFAAKTDYPTESSPGSVAIGDLDGDGKPDIVEANWLSNTVSVYKNNSSPGNFSFVAKPAIATALLPQNLALGDINGDGKTDLVVVNYGSKSFSVFINNGSAGTISFAPKTDITTGTDNPYGIVIGDLDGDGKADIFITNYNYTTTTNTSTAFSVFRNTGSTGTVSFVVNPYSIRAGEGYNPSIADINGDGRPDIIMPGQATYAATAVFQNQSTPGTIAFNNAEDFASISPFAALAADLDGDELPDIASANFTSSHVTIFKNVIKSPHIYSYSPVIASTGTSVSITGFNFTGVTTVSFGGVPASSFNIVNDGKITAIVGSGASGDLMVINAFGKGFSPNFTFAGPPVISSFTPVTAGNGMTVTIKGQNFNGTQSVLFGGVPASIFNIISPSVITAEVGSGSSGNVSVSTTYGTGILAGFNWVTIPAINSFTPASAGKDSIVTISGNNLTDVTGVSFGGIAANSFNIVNASTITAVVGNGSSGYVSISNSIATLSKAGFNFVPAPSIVSFSPASATVGTLVTITGKNFTGVSTVSFGGTAASSYSVISSDTIRAITDGNVSGNVTVRTTGGKASLAGFTNIAAPVISSFTPATGPTGTVVTINGSGFSPVIAANIVYFGSVRATVSSATTASLTVTVPTSSDYKNISITNNKLVASSAQPFNVTFPAIDSFTPGSFVRKGDFAGGAGSYALTADDVDGDGKPDIIVPNLYDKTVSIMRNTGSYGTISFAAPVSYACFWVPYFIATGDINGDGKPDIAISSVDKVSLFINTSSPGSISFTEHIDISLTTLNAFGLVLKDFDLDGRLDIAAITNTSNVGKICVLRNISGNGNISFAAPVSYTIGQDPWVISTADFDGDGKADLAAANRLSNSASVLRNTSSPGNISFGPRADFATNINPDAIAAGDLDGDGKIDLVTSNYGYVSLLRNISTPGNISFAAKMDVQTINIPKSIALGDLNGDGKTDIAVMGYDGVLPNVVALFKNKSTPGNLSFAQKTDIITDGAGPLSLADMNGDDQLDLLMPAAAKAAVAVYTNLAGSKIITACPGVNINDTAGKAGTSYQWQLNTGSGFANISNNTNYSGTNTAVLQINGLPGSWNGYHYRCVIDGINGIASILSIVQLATPVIISNNNIITVNNQDTAAFYTWQGKDAAGAWNDLSPAVTGISYTAPSSGGAYRVKAVKDNCAAYSVAQVIAVTAIASVPAINLGIHVYPNPVPRVLVIDSLQLSDRWQTIEIMSVDGKQKIKTSSIQNQTRVYLFVDDLKSGVYVAILRRNKGLPAVIKFVK